MQASSELSEQYHFEKLLATLRDTMKEMVPLIEEILDVRGKQVTERDTSTRAADMATWDKNKVNWRDQGDTGKGHTWLALTMENKGNIDFQHMWEAMNLAYEAKGKPSPFYFWTKDRQFMWFTQTKDGVYRRQKKA
jgi:hypothetical protein